MNYLCFTFSITDQKELYSEILTAHLAEAGFEMFEETDAGLNAYVQEHLFDEKRFNETELISNTAIQFSRSVVKYQNWNKDWESNFSPVVIADRVFIRAEFHDADSSYPYEIIIQPEMSFGTGHHDTTSGIIILMLDNDFENKTVCDMGCGTSILAVMAEKAGAAKVDAVDIDQQCVLNSKDNIIRNNCKHISVYQGDATFLNKKYYDIIIANINRNILLNDMPVYATALKGNGQLYLSGFYSEDLEAIAQQAERFGLLPVNNIISNNWCAALFRKT